MRPLLESAALLDRVQDMVLHSVAAGIAAVDQDGRQIYVNPAFARMVGFTQAELIGARPPYVYWPPEEIDAIGAAFAETVAGVARPDGYELRFMRRDGTRFDVLVTVRPMAAAGGQPAGWVASVTEITTRKTLQRERDRAASHQRFLSEASGVLSSSLDYEETLAAVAHLVVPLLADYCLVDLAEPDGSIRRVEVAHTDPEKVSLLRMMGERWPAHVSSEQGIAQVIRTGRSILAPEIPDSMLAAYTNDPERLALFRSLNLRSSIIAPIISRGTVLGALTLNSTRDDLRYDETDLALVEALGERAGIAIENARYHAAGERARVEAQRAADRTARLQSLTAALSEAATPQQVADAALRHGMAALGAVAGGVTLVEPDGAHQRVVAIEIPGVSSTVVAGWEVFPLDAVYPVNEAVRERRVVTADSFRDYESRYPTLAREMAGLGYEAYLAAPLEVEGRAIGCINYNFREQRSFDQEDLNLIVAMARQSSVAIERARLYESEHQARSRAEEANESKSRFLATMSHELRTPLNAVLGFVDLLQAEVEGALNERQHRSLSRIATATTHLIGVIDEILTFARLEAGREQVRVGEVDVAELVRDAVMLLESQASQSGLALHVELPERAHLHTDAGKLRQILLNLLGNAIKFTDQGTVGVELRTRPDGLQLVVWDTGRGIPQDQLDRIFEPFAQLDDSTTRQAGGTGLGLTVSRRLARLLGGELSVESRPGYGTRFVVELSSAT